LILPAEDRDTQDHHAWIWSTQLAEGVMNDTFAELFDR
jgi:hypothetical protein